MGIQGTGMPVQVALDRAAMERMDLARGAGHHFRGIDPVVRKIAYAAKNSRIPSASMLVLACTLPVTAGASPIRASNSRVVITGPISVLALLISA